jgi:hypothetical protein
MASDALAEFKKELRSSIRRKVAGGFYDVATITEDASEMCQDEEHPELAETLVPRLIQQAVNAQRKKQQTWPDVTDCDCLDAAFEELNTRGIVARQNFTCCSNCGHSEIGGEIDQELKAGVTVSGYAFYHQQDTDAAVEGGGIYIKYGDMAGDADAITNVGREIERAMKKHGLKTVWNGSGTESIYVRLKWKRRWPEE